MKQNLRINLIKALGLSGIQMDEKVAETIVLTYEHLKEEGDISLSDIDEIAKEVDAQFAPPANDQDPQIGLEKPLPPQSPEV